MVSTVNAHCSDGDEEKQEQKVEYGRPAWMTTLINSLTTWLQLVPKVSAQCDRWSSATHPVSHNGICTLECRGD